MRNVILAAFGISLIAIGGALSQSSDMTNSDDGEALQRSLEEKAVRIPASDLAAALAANDGGRSDRAQFQRRLPDWAAVREDLEQTREGDASEETNTQTGPINETRRLPRLAPPPGLRALAPERLQRVASAEVDRVSIPVLTPAHPDVRDNIKVYGLDNAYTASAVIDAGANLSISGACDRIVGGAPRTVDLRKRVLEGPPRLAGLRANYHITRNEFGADLSFSKFGCGYVVSIECGEPYNDERCTKDDYLIMISRSMFLLNANRAGGE